MTTQNYYEIVGVTRGAEESHISQAIDERYNKWRRLVTHHDPSIVAEAERSLRLLEQIRATLTDPVKRAAYDQGLETAGGLADPDALLRQATPAQPGTPPSARQSAAPEKRLDAWVCPACAEPGPVGKMHCASCGTAIGQTCPRCQSTSYVKDAFCSSCGVDIQVARAEDFASKQADRIAQIKKQIEGKREQIQRARRDGEKLFVGRDTADAYGLVIDGFLPNLLVLAGLGGWLYFAFAGGFDPFYGIFVRIAVGFVVFFGIITAIQKSRLGTAVAERISRLEGEIRECEVQIKQISAEQLD